MKKRKQRIKSKHKRIAFHGALPVRPLLLAAGLMALPQMAAAGFPANINLANLNGTTGFKLSGVAADDRSGYSVSAAGDVNGDGIADLIIGAFGANPNGTYTGASYVVFGKDTAAAGAFPANLELSSLDGTTGFRLSGVDAFDLSGFSVSAAGDINGDGIADLIIGAIQADPNGAYSGASYVVFGKDTATAGVFPANLELSSLDGTTGFKLSGVAAGDISGHSVSAAGDINGDDVADLLIGAPGADPNGAYSGASYVVFGKDTATAGAFPANLELSSLDGTTGFKLSGAAFYDSSGRSVSAAGDINGDGIADLLIGALGAGPNSDSSGASYVVFGKDTATAGAFPANFELSSLDGTTGFKLSGVAALDRSGNSVSAAGDINGDDVADLIIGASRAGPNGRYSGASYVVFGKDTATAGNFPANLELASLDGTTGFKLSGVAAYDRSGRSVSAAGDINGDGVADLIIGADGAGPNGRYSGASYVVFGKDTATAGAFPANFELSSLDGTTGFKLSGVAAYDHSGNSVSAAGDINGDGIADLIIGAYRADPNGTYSGASYVVFGQADTALLCDGKVPTIIGTAGDDQITGTDGPDVIQGLGGRDTLLGGEGNDAICGGLGEDILMGQLGDDRLFGQEGNDFLIGNNGADVLEGGEGHDRLFGHRGDDQLSGGIGDDRLDGGGGVNDVCDGGLGTDTALNCETVITVP